MCRRKLGFREGMPLTWGHTAAGHSAKAALLIVLLLRFLSSEVPFPVADVGKTPGELLQLISGMSSTDREARPVLRGLLFY